jgi:hypothetical protein
LHRSKDFKTATFSGSNSLLIQHIFFARQKDLIYGTFKLIDIDHSWNNLFWFGLNLSRGNEHFLASVIETKKIQIKVQFLYSNLPRYLIVFSFIYYYFLVVVNKYVMIWHFSYHNHIKPRAILALGLIWASRVDMPYHMKNAI